MIKKWIIATLIGIPVFAIILTLLPQGFPMWGFALVCMVIWWAIFLVAQRITK